MFTFHIVSTFDRMKDNVEDKKKADTGPDTGTYLSLLLSILTKDKDKR